MLGRGPVHAGLQATKPASEWNQERVLDLTLKFRQGKVVSVVGEEWANGQIGGRVQAGALTDRRTPRPGAHGARVLALLLPLEDSGAPAGEGTPADA